jgi:hypothetical protein
MNEVGLAFERLSAYHPNAKNFSGKISISNPTKYLKDILHNCKTVEEVKNFISKYDYSFFIDDIFIYVDKSGKYLIVEPYSLTIGNNPTYVISNFCPSITTENDASKLVRYSNGIEFLKTKIDATLAFCTALSDTMHVCRKKIGDGTLLTSIWDLKHGTVNLFFYHQYDFTVQFNLEEELQKGNHIIAIEGLFPYNSEFEKLKNYKTPKNSIFLRLFVAAATAMFFFSSLVFLILYFRKKPNTIYAIIQLLLFPLGLLLSYYMFVLLTNINIYYFPSPYQHPSNIFVSITSYIPFLMLVIIIPFGVIIFRLFREKCWSLFAKILFVLNYVVYFILIGLFVYWGFYNVFS